MPPEKTTPEPTTPPATPEPSAPAAPAVEGNEAAKLAATVLAGAPAVAPKGSPMDGDGLGDTPDDAEDLEFQASTADVDDPAKGAPAPAATEAPVPAATPSAPAGAPAEPPAAGAPVVPPAVVPPSAEPAKPAQPAAQPPEAWVPPNLFAESAPSIPATQPAATPPAAVTPAAAAPAQAPAAAPEQAQVREQYLEQLTQYYTPGNEEEVRALSLEPEKALPRMFARAHVDVLDAVVQGISNELPRLVQSTVNRMVTEARASKSFYDAWPQLAKTEFTATVQRLMSAYRSQFPAVEMDQMIRDVGAAAMVGLRLPLPGMPAAPPVVPPMPAVAPANPGGGTGGGQGRPTGIFEALDQGWEEEEKVEEI